MKLRCGWILGLMMAALMAGEMSGIAWAQGDDRIAFASDRDGNLEIYVMSRDGGSVQRLTHHNAQDIDPAWSPDRQQIAFVSNRDGSNFAVYLMHADGSNVRRVTPDDANYYTAPAWSPDGRYLALVSDRTGNLDLHTLELSSGALRTLTDDPSEDNEPSWAPDGSRIAFSSFRTGYGEIYTVSANGGSAQPLTSGSGADNLAPVWSPDGTQLAFVANSGLFSEIYIVNADGSNERNLITVDEYFIDSPSWSPDGQHITYQVSKPGEKATIRSIQTDGNGARQVTAPDHESKWPAWSTPRGGTVNVSGGNEARGGLRPGAQATVHVLRNDDLNLRMGAGLGFDTIERLPDGTPVTLLEGPFSADGDLWWYVRTPSGREGYIVEYADSVQTLIPQNSSTDGASADALACYAAPPSRVRVGMQAFLDGHGYDVNLRSANNYQSTRIRLLPSGTSVEIIGGPQCGADAERTYVWWQVRVISTNELGWVAEGDSVQNPTIYVIVPAD